MKTKMTNAIRPTTLSLFVAAIEKTWPSPAVCVDFGIDSRAHFEALALPIINDEITMSQMDAALGKGAELTRLTRDAPSNPHKTLVFQTSWDVLLQRHGAATPQRGPDPSHER
jgi:hypothetical protein